MKLSELNHGSDDPSWREPGQIYSAIPGGDLSIIKMFDKTRVKKMVVNGEESLVILYTPKILMGSSSNYFRSPKEIYNTYADKLGKDAPVYLEVDGKLYTTKLVKTNQKYTKNQAERTGLEFGVGHTIMSDEEVKIGGPKLKPDFSKDELVSQLESMGIKIVDGKISKKDFDRLKKALREV